MLAFQLGQISEQLLGHAAGVDAGDFAGVLLVDQFAEIAQAVAPGDPVGDQQKRGVGSIFGDDAGDVADHVGLLAAGSAVGFGLDQDARVIFVVCGKGVTISPSVSTGTITLLPLVFRVE